MRRDRRSQITEHPERARIEYDLALGVPMAEIARKYGVHYDSVRRHRKKLPPQHLAALAVQALKPGADLEQLRVEESDRLLGHLVAQRGRIYSALDVAEATGDLRAVASLHGQIRANLELTARVVGLLTQHARHTRVNILVMPEWSELRALLLETLRPFPAARRAVAAALREREDRAAREIMVQHGGGDTDDD